MAKPLNPFEDGIRAAEEDIPAEANPFEKGTDGYAQWKAGHESAATAEEASQSEG